MRPEGSTQLRVNSVPVPSSVGVLGVGLAITDYEQTLEWIDSMVAARSRGYTCACSVPTVMAAGKDPELRAALRGALLNLPDGQSLVWAMGALGYPRAARISGDELMSRACARAVDSAQRFYLYGGRTQGGLVQLALNLRQRHPGLKLVGAYSSPGLPMAEEEQVAIAEEINRSRADVVWVGAGASEPEKWMAQMRQRLEAPVLVGVGAAEPGGSWRGHLRYDATFVRAFARQLVSQRRSRQAPAG